jgi:hypothetical protein
MFLYGKRFFSGETFSWIVCPIQIIFPYINPNVMKTYVCEKFLVQWEFTYSVDIIALLIRCGKIPYQN